MKTALGVVLPVSNAQDSLPGAIAGILEVLPEWAERFELWLVDDGSSDDTAEVTRELAALYPQLRVIRHPVRRGLVAAIQTGLEHCPAEFILIGNDAYRLHPDDLRTLWRLREGQRQFAKAESARPAVGLQQSRSTNLPEGSLRRLGFQAIRRATFEQFYQDRAIDTIARVDVANRAKGPAGSRPNFLGRVKRFALGE